MTRDEAVRRFEPLNAEFAAYDREGVRGDFASGNLPILFQKLPLAVFTSPSASRAPAHR